MTTIPPQMQAQGYPVGMIMPGVPAQMMPAGFPMQGAPVMMGAGFPGPQQVRPAQMGGYYGAPQQPQYDLLGQFQNLNLNQPRSTQKKADNQERKKRMNELPSLYVSGLPLQNFLDLDFFKFFTSKGYKVKNAKVVIDSRTNKPRGYGYLQFVDPAEADRCLREMNNQTLMGNALRIVKSTSEPKFEKDANLLVKNIDKEVTQQEIYDKFSAFGNVVSCKLETYPNSKESRGYAYVQFEKPEDAQRAIDTLNGQELKGKKLEVTTKKEKKDLDKKDAKPTAVESNNLFVKNLPQGTTDEKLKSMFGSFGAIISASVQRNDKGDLKDYGYVCFKEIADAKKAIDAMNKKNLGGDQFLIVNYFVSKKDTELAQGSRTLDPIAQNITKTFNSNIYVKGLPPHITEDELRKKFTFADDAKIISLKLNGKARQIDGVDVISKFAYIMYDNVANAQKAIQRFDGTTPFGGSKPISVEMWVGKEEKEQERKQRENRQTK